MSTQEATVDEQPTETERTTLADGAGAKAQPEQSGDGPADAPCSQHRYHHPAAG